MKLERLGWKPFFQRQLAVSDRDLIPARVRRLDLDRYHLLGETGAMIGILPGRTRAQASSRADLPTVGDWVLVSRGSPALIERTLTRFSKFSRKEAGDRAEEQVLAANIDTVFIVSGLDGNFSPARIERYVLLSWQSGARPVVVLNKADLCQDLDEKLATVTNISPETPVHAISALEDTTLTTLREYCGPGQTVALLGSSGVGKSTIINVLLGYEHFETGEVRQGDARGRHTTTFRELCPIPDGGLIIDTPGMRELQLWADESALASAFDDVESLAASCRFRDCEHASEPGCAVTGAIESGRLDPARLENYRKLKEEIARLARSTTQRNRRRKPFRDRQGPARD